MSMNATAAPPKQRPAAGDPVVAYAEWRMSCTSVWAAYRQWSNALKADADLAHAAYTAALDREDAAARAYSRLMKRRKGRDRAASAWLERQLPNSV
jgi:hypothetical protein